MAKRPRVSKPTGAPSARKRRVHGKLSKPKDVFEAADSDPDEEKHPGRYDVSTLASFSLLQVHLSMQFARTDTESRALARGPMLLRRRRARRRARSKWTALSMSCQVILRTRKLTR